MSGHFIDLDAWPRRSAWAFFRTFEVPFFDVCVEVPVGPTRAWCAAAGRSFNQAAWFGFQRAVNAVEPFRMRLRGDRVWAHDRVRVATTLLNPDGSFRYLHVPWAPSFEAFEANMREAREAPPPSTLDARPDDDAVVHGSVVPWLRFTGLQHARPRLIPTDSVPKVVFGRVSPTPTGEVMPISISAHHALVDGLHVGQLVDRFTAVLAEPATHLGTAPLSGGRERA